MRGTESCCGVLLVVLLLMAAASSTHAAAPPNIVLIVSDDQGYNDLGVLNSSVISPALDRLAREGTRLTNFYVTWPACTPSRGSLLTGRYPQRNGVYDMIRNEAPDFDYLYRPAEYEVTFERIGGMDEREVLLPAVLAQAGYRCGIFGKWDLGSLRRFLPQQRGFNEFYGFVNTGIDYFTHERYGVPSMYSGNELTTADRGTYCTDLFRDHALNFIRKNQKQPFFLYVPFNAPHSASNLDRAIRGAPQAPEEYRQLFPHLNYDTRIVMRDGREIEVPTTGRKKQEYLGSVAAMDAAIGQILKLLDDLQLTERTFVFFCSDNGGSGAADNSPLRGHKGQMFEGGIRVCAVARYPGMIPAGSVNNELLTTLELFPTLAKLSTALLPENVILDGADMLPVLAGQQPSARQEMYWQRRDHSAARVGNWKWIRQGKEEFLFDLSSDTGEQKNLIADRPEQAETMRNHFKQWEETMEAAEPRGPFRDY